MRIFIFFVLLLATTFGCQMVETVQEHYTVSSPDQKVTVQFLISDEGKAAYKVAFNNNLVIGTSYMAFDFKDMKSFEDKLEIIGSSSSSFNETWQMPWGEQREVINHYNELTINLQETKKPKRRMNITFRVYNDGLGFRYEFPEQEGITEMIIMDERTQFNLTGDHTTWWIPGDWDIYEHLYNTTKFSEINAIAKRDHPDLVQTYIPENAVNTPVTMRSADSVHLSFHEAALTDYAGMTLKVDTVKLMMENELVGSDRLGYKVKRSLPFHTPWRTIQISENAAGLIESNLIVNLNEPNKLGDVSWFTPMKYTGIWWGMHLGKLTWKMDTGKHGATTENVKRLIDFTAKHKIGGVLVEGWNTGWERWIGFEDREGVFDFVTPYPDYNLQEVVEYAKDKGVQIIMHHETSAAPRTYEQQLEAAFQLMANHDMHVVKTGYVGKIIPKGEYHHGQWMVNHYRRVLIEAARHHIAVNAHEPIKDTGIRRTYPNAISREGLRGQEFNAWASDGGNPPEHLSIVAFTRMLAGPIDYTPGIFNIKLNPYKPENQVNTTLAQQLALYVVIYSPLQMVPDLIEHYEDQPGFQFIQDVAVDWDKSIVLNGEVGDFVTIARKKRDYQDWYIGGITDENERTISLTFEFLNPNDRYLARIYKDAEGAHWNDNPTALDITERVVTTETTLDLWMAPGGGFAISIIRLD
jgi:hypothetical protein